MDEQGWATGATGRTTVERTSDRDVVATRTFDAPVSRVFEAWTVPALFRRWWAPRSIGVPLLSCEMDVRTGGGYRLEFGQEGGETMAFFGRYVEVVPGARMVWTNDEAHGAAAGGDGEGALTTVTFADRGGGTLLTFHDRHPSKEALDEAFAMMESATPEQFDQLDTLLAASRGEGGS